jgi:DNA-binding response OmpR family regulator
MIRLIVTADDELYNRLARRAEAEGDMPRRATDVLAGFKQVTTQPTDMIFVDMSLRAADTLLEALRSREETASVPLVAVIGGQQLPFELRRLCAAVLEVETL